MDSDHSSTSVLDPVDANLDIILDDSPTSAAPSTSTTVDVTPAATAAGRICRCPCGRRMSSLTHDYHTCTFCSGIDVMSVC